uniref:Uncharacterized protein n=1 Tax=Arundo donax TaxID=35708 RepID=A0A0A9CG93_ARUDO
MSGCKYVPSASGVTW